MVAGTEVRQDTYSGGLSQDWGDTEYITDAQRYASAPLAYIFGAAAVGAMIKYEGSWVSGGSLTVGCEWQNASVTSYVYLGIGHWHFVVSGAASGYGGAFRFTVPTPPAGVTFRYAAVRLYEGTEPYSFVTVGLGATTYEVPMNGGGTACPAPYPPDYYWYLNDFWAGCHKHLTASLEVVYDYDDDPDCDEMDATDITWDGAQLHGGNNTHYQWGVDGDEVGAESEDGVLTGLTADTWYWYKALSYCEKKTFWFKTKKEDDPTTWQASIITLPATEVWATGATIHGLFWYKGNSRVYVYLGFQYGLNSDVSGETIHWLYSFYTSENTPENGSKTPIQTTISGLLPDRTYYYRACLHVGAPPMTANNYFGATLSFGGPVSIFGHGWEYVTAKKAEDDVSKLAVGRYYADKSGNIKYESAKHRGA
jgi:hypothetical protein